jgi:RsiW-degrading membrane proteinase PrsW (M82 family)
MLIVLVALLGALLPTIVYVSLAWWLDRYEKEPFWLLALAFLWGAVPAAILSIALELLLDIPIYAIGGDGLAANLVSVSLSAPIVEESCKGLALVGLALLFHREFDSIVDGIVYGAMIGFGFAMTENFAAYFIPILSKEGIAAGLVNVFLRTVVFGVNHGFWTAVTGVAVAYARLSPDWGRRLMFPVVGWSAAVIFHGIHNAGATLAEQTLCLSLGFSLVVDWGGVLILLVVAALALRKESSWIRQGLAEEVRRGALSPQEFELLRSAGRRVGVRWQAWSRGGWEAYRAVGRYFESANALAVKTQYPGSRGDEGRHSADVHRLRRELAAHRVRAWPWLWPTGS